MKQRKFVCQYCSKDFGSKKGERTEHEETCSKNKSKGSKGKDSKKSRTGEWGAEDTLNMVDGCIHNCKYCWARSLAVNRYHRMELADWKTETIRWDVVEKKPKKREGPTMFPSTHDITTHTVAAYERVAIKNLEIGNKLLIVSKPEREVISRLIRTLAKWKDQIIFRFSIGTADEEIRQFWEPNAPPIPERVECLKAAFDAGYKTSVSCEPLLSPWGVRELVEMVQPYVTDSIWIGKLDEWKSRTADFVPSDDSHLLKLLEWQEDEKVLSVVEQLSGNPLVHWKGTYQKVIDKAKANTPSECEPANSIATPPVTENQQTLVTVPGSDHEFKPFPVEILPEPLRAFIVQAATSICCDASFIAVPLLTALATAIGNTRRIELKPGWTEPAVLWTALIGDSGAGKSPALTTALQWLRQHEETSDLLCVTDDCTIAAAGLLLSNNPRGVCMSRDELAPWLKGDTTRWLAFFNASNLKINRKIGQGETLNIPHAAMSITGGIQPAILQRYLTDAHYESGLAARLLLVYPPPVRKKWQASGIADSYVDAVSEVFTAIWDLPSRADTAVKLSPEATEVWGKFYDEQQECFKGFDSTLKAAGEKLTAYAARLALIVRIVRCVCDKADDMVIDLASIQAGITLARWFRDECIRVYGLLRESETDRQQRELVKLIQELGGSITARELMKHTNQFSKSAEKAKAALSELVKAGLGHWEKKISPKGGRPSERFVLAIMDITDKTPIKNETNTADDRMFTELVKGNLLKAG